MSELWEKLTDFKQPCLGTKLHRRFAIPINVDLNDIVPNGVREIMCITCEDLSVFSLPCMHELCRKCFQDMQQCPKHKGVKIDEDEVYERDYTTIPVSCPNKSKGCQRRMLLDEISNHLTICDYKIIDCSRCEETMPLLNLGPHLSAGCGWRLDECPFCSNPMNSKDISKHIERCPSKKSVCCVTITEDLYKKKLCAKTFLRTCCPRCFILFLGNVSENFVSHIGRTVIFLFAIIAVIIFVFYLAAGTNQGRNEPHKSW